jgi:hypothetical protein
MLLPIVLASAHSLSMARDRSEALEMLECNPVFVMACMIRAVSRSLSCFVPRVALDCVRVCQLHRHCERPEFAYLIAA